ncbi:hypothetical protein V5E97_38005 [Singulisphaera sp. Ch08]|uniref:Uncharacterized protein n=1 Tax=Singulisphaera sp. Ch08 TaxID=3120278 RepID=A0AAU7CG34_9BACT
MTLSNECPTCKTTMPDDAPKGLCPSCLLRWALETLAGKQSDNFTHRESGRSSAIEPVDNESGVGGCDGACLD